MIKCDICIGFQCHANRNLTAIGEKTKTKLSLLLDECIYVFSFRVICMINHCHICF